MDSSHIVSQMENKKKTFNKKKWRQAKYNKGFKVKQWQENRKKKLLQRYHKEFRKDTLTPYSSINDSTCDNKSSISNVGVAQLELERIKQVKQNKKEEIVKRKQEVQEALQRYKKKRTETFKKLSQHTKKGQPVMKGRMELLYEKIKKSIIPK